MLENLTARLAGIVKHVRGEARLTEANIQEALREVRIALLEADVALPVVKHSIEAVRGQALGEEADAKVDRERDKRVAEKVRKGKGCDLEDFREQVAQMKKMGGAASLIDKLPAQLAGQVDPAKLADDKQLKRIEGIINSMT